MNKTQNCSKYLLTQSKSFIKIEKNNSKTKSDLTNNKSCNSTNIKKNKNKNKNKSKRDVNTKNKIEYKKMELTGLTKSTNNLYQNYYNKNINNDKYTNYFTNIKKTEGNSRSKMQNLISDYNSDINNTDNNNNKSKKIYLMKPVYIRKNSFNNNNNNNKSIENSNVNTNQSSICSKNRNYKNICDENILNDFLNNNITNPEELHFFYVKILQKSKDISKKFEN